MREGGAAPRRRAPPCERPGCPFRAHSSPNGYAIQQGWGGFCCNACAEGLPHGVRCERVAVWPGFLGGAELESASTEDESETEVESAPAAPAAPGAGAYVDLTTPGRDALWDVLAGAARAVGRKEHEWTTEKLALKLCEYFRKAARSVIFGKLSWEQLIREYVDSVYSLLFTSLHEREWMQRGEVNFVDALYVGIMENFPPNIFKGVLKVEFDKVLSTANARALDEQRFMLVVHSGVRENLQGPKLRRKLINAADAGRQQAARSVFDPKGEYDIDEFVRRLIDGTIMSLSKSSDGEPGWILPESAAARFFHDIIRQGALPLSFTRSFPLQSHDWRFIDGAVRQAYQSHTESALPPSKKQRATLPQGARAPHFGGR